MRLWPWSLWTPEQELTPGATSNPSNASAAHPNYMIQAMKRARAANNFYHITCHQVSEQGHVKGQVAILENYT
jgi:hypothetical protein